MPSGGGDISIHAPHTGRDAEQAVVGSLLLDISIHAPHTGRDRVTGFIPPLDGPISIHAPHTGRDIRRWSATPSSAHFNPRAPYGARPKRELVRHVNLNFNLTMVSKVYFNPRTPYGARLEDTKEECYVLRISIHAPHTGRDSAARSLAPALLGFQSTHPIRGATPHMIGFHSSPQDFNPRAPYGARPTR